MDHPDYYEIINEPMYLEKMLFKARDVKYASASALISDLALLRENCRAYCSESYPSLVEDAESLYAEATGLMKKLGVVDGEEGKGNANAITSTASSSSSAAATAVTGSSSVGIAPGDKPKGKERTMTVALRLGGEFSPFLVRVLTSSHCTYIKSFHYPSVISLHTPVISSLAL